MAFQHSTLRTLSKDEICSRAQPFCDTDMEANFHAGKMHGAWSSNKTLIRHGLVNITAGGANYIDGVGFRGQKNRYTLTSDGEKFIEELLRKFPQGAPTIQQTTAPSPGHTAGIKRSPFHTPTRARRPASATMNRSKDLAKVDEEKLRSWIATAQINGTMDFKVGKARRKQLHDACDDLECEMPGFKLAHSSTNETDTSSRRVLTVRVIQRPHDSLQGTGSAKRRLIAASRTYADSISSSSVAKRPRLPPSVAAAQAALQRQAMYEASNHKAVASSNGDSFGKDELELAIELSNDDGFDGDELNRGLELSRKLAPESLPLAQDLEEIERRAIEESIKMARQSAAIRGSETDASDSDDDLLNYSPFGDQKQPAKKSFVKKKEARVKRSLFPKDSSNEPIELLSDDEDTPISSMRDESRILASRGVHTEAIPSVKVHSTKPTSRAPIAAERQEVIDIDDDSKNDDEIIEIEDSQDVVILDDSQDSIAPVAVTTSNTKSADSGSTLPHLYILIDNRERNKNSTPRHLRMELTRLVKHGVLKDVWPGNMPIGIVEERGLSLGDFAFDIECCSSKGRKCIPVSVERKRVSHLVQRSVSGDRWRQFMRMRDNCVQSIFLIETDTLAATRFTAFGAQELEGWDPHRTLIDDERSIFLFFWKSASLVAFA